jgi:hypothetical protein
MIERDRRVAEAEIVRVRIISAETAQKLLRLPIRLRSSTLSASARSASQTEDIFAKFIDSADRQLPPRSYLHTDLPDDVFEVSFVFEIPSYGNGYGHRQPRV